MILRTINNFPELKESFRQFPNGSLDISEIHRVTEPASREDLNEMFSVESPRLLICTTGSMFYEVSAKGYTRSLFLSPGEAVMVERGSYFRPLGFIPFTAVGLVYEAEKLITFGLDSREVEYWNSIAYSTFDEDLLAKCFTPVNGKYRKTFIGQLLKGVCKNFCDIEIDDYVKVIQDYRKYHLSRSLDLNLLTEIFGLQQDLIDELYIEHFDNSYDVYDRQSRYVIAEKHLLNPKLTLSGAASIVGLQEFELEVYAKKKYDCSLAELRKELISKS